MSSDGNQAPRRIRVLEMRRGSPDGVTVHRYLAGETYGPDTDPPMPADLAVVFLRECWGQEVQAKALVDVPGNKMLDGAEETKDGNAGAAADGEGEDTGAPVDGKSESAGAPDPGAADDVATDNQAVPGDQTDAGAAAPEPEAAPTAASRVHAHEERAEADAVCEWCDSLYTARAGRGGPAQRFCSDRCRAAFNGALRGWARRELEAGRLDIADLREA